MSRFNNFIRPEEVRGMVLSGIIELIEERLRVRPGSIELQEDVWDSLRAAIIEERNRVREINHKQGYEEGIQRGRAKGYDEGYSAGYEDGVED